MLAEVDPTANLCSEKSVSLEMLHIARPRFQLFFFFFDQVPTEILSFAIVRAKANFVRGGIPLDVQAFVTYCVASQLASRVWSGDSVL